IWEEERKISTLSALRTILALIGHVLLGWSSSQSTDPSREFDALYAAIRDQKIDRPSAVARVRELLPRIRDDFYERGGVDTPAGRERFPVQGYGAESIGGSNGSGYSAKGYDWFDGYKSAGHPGHDIFIHDRNQDALDDRTGQPVNILSIASGIVVAYSSEWSADSNLRGGRYIYIYSPAHRGIFYYAHARSVTVRPGDLVTAGQRIGTVGRSGRNASAARSPTHLHVMFLSIDDGLPKPGDIYPMLKRLGRR
ncbi:MAG TPA: M23 family metallopeptidase, partial [Vicinamibacterales bacterium]|nr:M23 family metallopeptidase [Vicinamibacterales bacterium]